MNKLLAFLISCIILSSCGVSQKVPGKEKRAKKKLTKHLIASQKIINVYPNLSDTLITTVLDTMVINEYTVDTVFQIKIDTVQIDNLLNKYVAIQGSIKQIKANKLDLSDRNKREIYRLARIRENLRNLLIKASTKDTTFVYEDSILTSITIVKDGTYTVKYTVKKKEIPYVKTTNIINPDCDVRKHFWQDKKLYLLLLILFIIGYFLRSFKRN